MTLTDFLIARIREDAAAANAADLLARGVDRISSHTLPEFADYMTRFQPNRILADCEAKRRIVELHHMSEPERYWSDVTIPQGGSRGGDWVWSGGVCDLRTAGGEYGEHSTDGEYRPCATLRALALPYADHPEFREEWKP